MKYIIVIISVIFSFYLAGCQSASFPIEPSIYLLSTDKEPRSFLNEIADELKKSRYEVESLDLNVGLLVMEPRRFTILRGDQKSYASQKFQMRQEGGSVKLRITYECEYENGVTECDTKDEYAMEKIRRIERIIMSMINRRLFKKPGEETTKSKEI